MMKETIIQTRVEKHIIKSSDKYFSVLIDFCHKAKNLYNHANYFVRQTFTTDKKWIRYAELDKLLGNDNPFAQFNIGSGQYVCSYTKSDCEWLPMENASGLRKNRYVPS